MRDGDADALAVGGPYRSAASTNGDHAAAAERAAADVDRGAPGVAPVARVKARRSWRERFVIVGAVVAAVGLRAYIVHRVDEEGEAADAGLAELRRLSDDICACTTGACIREIIEARRDASDRAQRAAEKGGNRDALESIASQIETCRRDIARAEARTAPDLR